MRAPHPRRARRRASAARAALAAALTLVLAAACGGGSDSTGPTGQESSSGTAAAEGGTLRVGVPSLSTSDSLDPAAATTTGGYVIARQLFDTLVEYGTGGQVAMRLAESMEPDPADASSWTVVLRDAVWHDGTPVTADDVVATVQRWFSEQLPPASSLPFIDPARVTVVDEKTVHFQLGYPTMTFPDALTSPTTAIVPASFDPATPIGSGPFKLGAMEPGTRVTFTANDDYFVEDEPYVDTLEVISFPDSTSEANALIGGQIDVASAIDPTLIPIVESGGDGFDVFEYATTGTLTWQMNVEQEPFDDPRVRQALRLAVDRDQIVEQVYAGHASVGNDVFGPTDPAYDDTLAQREQDLDKARALLAEAGYPDGVDVELTAAPIQPTATRQNEVLVQQAAEAGFRITFNEVDSATYYGDAYGTYPLSLSFWGFLSIFDQAAFTIVDNAPYNATHWQDDEYNALYQQAVRTVDDAERTELVHQMQAIEYDRGAYVVAVFLNSITAHSTTVTGFEAYPNSDGPVGYNFSSLRFDG
ncbi:ABC transporter substrate-binding protein [Jiangella endophytica]|uniref:ABC transporter substrate-binding protein n=1 Tax=Jiangella endophytica TaxID=1623398 RepID=UPI000E34F74B|nr:ABC transporter substrate-binding protein [Jiangella endophytica]